MIPKNFDTKLNQPIKMDYEKIPLQMIMEPLYKMQKTAFDPKDEEHRNMLKEIWELLKPNEILSGLISEQCLCFYITN